MKKRLIPITTAALLAGGMALAQQAVPAPQPSPGQHARAKTWRQHRAQRFQKLADALNLTSQQREQAKTILQEARQTAQPVRQQLKAGRQQLADAIKTGKSDADIHTLANHQGNLVGQLIAIRTEAFQKCYGLLTPVQRQKAEQLRQHMREMFGPAHKQVNG